MPRTFIPQDIFDAYNFCQYLRLLTAGLDQVSLTRFIALEYPGAYLGVRYETNGTSPVAFTCYCDAGQIVLVGPTPSRRLGVALVGSYERTANYDDDASQLNRTIGLANDDLYSRMNLSSQGRTPCAFAGYSMGGGVAEALANRYRVREPNREASCRSFGSPRVGGPRWAGYSSTLNAFRWMNVGDPVPIWPPKPPEISTLYFGSSGTLSPWGYNWFHTGPGAVLRDATVPQVVPDTGGSLQDGTYLSLAGWITNLLAYPIEEHHIGTYERRLLWSVNRANQLAAEQTEPPVVERVGPPVTGGPRVIVPLPTLPLQQPQPHGGAPAVNPDPLVNVPRDAAGNPLRAFPVGQFYAKRKGRVWCVWFNGQVMWQTNGRQAARRHAARLNSASRSFNTSRYRSQVDFVDAVAAEFTG